MQGVRTAMNQTDSGKDMETLRAEAAAWVVRLHADDAGEDDWLALESWLAESPERQSAFDHAEQVWAAFDEPGLAGAAADRWDRDPVVVDLARRRRARPARTWAPIGAIAAGIVAAVVVAGALLLRPAPSPAQLIATGAGETRLVRLADGSDIRLGSNTRLTASIGGGLRRVALEGGEAEFEVAKDHAHPFVISVGDQQVTVVGTHFDILRDQGRVTVTVAGGVVEVRGVAPSASAAAFRLTPGDQLSHVEGAPNSVVSRVAVDDVFAWTKGYLVFRDEALSAVAEDLNRQFPVPIRVEGSARRLRFSGVLMLDREDAVVDRLRRFLPVTVVHAPNAVVLQPR